MRRVWPFILCGGVGTRLWPLSREAYPKQFHRLTGHETLFQETCRRFTGPPFGELWILANHRHRFLIAEQLEEIGLGAKNIVLEPVSRNTAPSAAIAALIATGQDPEALVLLAPSDHMIADTGALVRAVEAGFAFAEAGALVTFGVEPDCPPAGYGYIEVAPERASAGNVLRFVEKPSPEAAERYLEQGNFYWKTRPAMWRQATVKWSCKRRAVASPSASVPASHWSASRTWSWSLWRTQYWSSPRIAPSRSGNWSTI
jgi:mannose-1-phosphate guanylyltransferase/mannose-6-phosphate isomerase